MNIAILSRNPVLYSTQSLARAARRRHHFVRIIDYNNCDIIIDHGALRISYHGEVLEKIDAIIPRIGASVTSYGAAVIRQFEEIGIFTSLPSDALLKARDKLSCLQLLSSKGIPVPKTIVSNNHLIYSDLLNYFMDEQVVIKLINGTHGLGVVLAESKAQAETLLEAFNKSRQKALMQEFIRESNGADIRIFIVDQEIVGTMKRQAREGEFRSNLHRGASSSIEKISEREKQLALKATQILGLKIAGVDMLRSDRGPLILEVNASPGLEGIETTTRRDVAGKIITYIERNAVVSKKYREWH